MYVYTHIYIYLYIYIHIYTCVQTYVCRMHLDFTGATFEFSHFHVCGEKDAAAHLITAQRQPRLRCHKSKSNPLVLPPLLRANLRQEVSGSIVPSIGPGSKAFCFFLREPREVAPCVRMRKKKEKEERKRKRKPTTWGATWLGVYF